MHEGENVEISIDKDTLLIRRGRPSYALEDLVKEAKTLAPPPSIDDAPQGDEML